MIIELKDRMKSDYNAIRSEQVTKLKIGGKNYAYDPTIMDKIIANKTRNQEMIIAE